MKGWKSSFKKGKKTWDCDRTNERWEFLQERDSKKGNNWSAAEERRQEQVSSRKHMEEKIRSLYVRMIQEKNEKENQKEKISQKTQEAVHHLWKEKEWDKNMESEEILDKVLLTACAAKENGFVLGFKYAFRLFAECIQE